MSGVETTEEGHPEMAAEGSLDKLHLETKPIIPLCIPSVLDQILDYLPVSDLKHARLVCQQWADEGGKILTRKSKVVFKASKDVISFLETLRNANRGTGNESSAKLLRRVTNFQFDVGERYNSFHYTIKSTESVIFFEEMGSTIQSLRLKIGAWKLKDLDANFFATIPNVEIFSLTGRFGKDLSSTESFLLPSIKTFEANIFPAEREEYDDNLSYDAKIGLLRSSFQILLKRMPNLTKIKGSVFEFISVPMSMWIVNAPAPLRFLSQLEVHMELNESEVLLLKERKFPLSHLQLAINPGIRFRGLWTFISSIGETLEKLKLDLRIRPINHPGSDVFPCSRDLKKLKSLKFRCFDGSLDFVQHLTKLRCLQLEDGNLSSAFREECDVPNLTMINFKVLNCNSSAGRFSFENVYKNMVKFFPNLRKLRMDYLSDPTIRIIFGGLPQLENLAAFQGIYTDEGLLGIAPNKLISSETADSSADESENPAPDRRLPNLLDLKRIRGIALESPRLTDAVLIHGLLNCREIKNLVIASPNITDGALKEIVDKMDLHYLELKREYQHVTRFTSWSFKDKKMGLRRYHVLKDDDDEEALEIAPNNI